MLLTERLISGVPVMLPPEERPHNAGRLYGPEWQAHLSEEIFISIRLK
jgi:hypothetical protein